MSPQLASTMRTDFLVWECHCCLLERWCTVYVVEVDASSQGTGIQILYRKIMQQHGTFGEMTKPTNCVQSSWWLNNQQFAAMYPIHSVPVPLTWLHKKRVSSSIATRTGSCSDSVSYTHDASQIHKLSSKYIFQKSMLVAQDKIQGAHWEQH